MLEIAHLLHLLLDEKDRILGAINVLGEILDAARLGQITHLPCRG